ncbi:MAG: hypothetical protein ACHWZW_02840 [Spirulina sp.]
MEKDVFVLQSGGYESANLGYAYGRRAQATVKVLRWADWALLRAESPESAIALAKATVVEWVTARPFLKSRRWRVEGRGHYITFCQELNIEPDEPQP